MIHEIAPDILDNQFRREKIQKDSKVMIFFEGRLLLSVRDGLICYPRYAQVAEKIGRQMSEATSCTMSAVWAP